MASALMAQCRDPVVPCIEHERTSDALWSRRGPARWGGSSIEERLDVLGCPGVREFVVVVLGEDELLLPARPGRARWGGAGGSRRGSGGIGGVGHGAQSLAPVPGSGREILQGDLDERCIADHRVEILLLPDLHHVGEDGTSFRLVGDDAGGRGKIG
jgi:hypothetical protein